MVNSLCVTNDAKSSNPIGAHVSPFKICARVSWSRVVARAVRERVRVIVSEEEERVGLDMMAMTNGLVLVKKNGDEGSRG